MTNPWAKKAAALDQYRWRLLRGRYGVFQSALRFSRDAIKDWGYGLLARLRLERQVSHSPCDFLMMQASPKVILLGRKRGLLEGLRKRGFILYETAQEERYEILKNRKLKQPPCQVPLRYFAYAAYAEWVVSRYQPKVLLNDRNGSFYSPFLRLSLCEKGSKLVHLAHATLLESSPKLGMIDYDYYFIFGQSSIDALKKRNLMFGRASLIPVGSHMIDHSYDLPLSDEKNKNILLLGVGPDREKDDIYLDAYNLVKDWAVKNPEYQLLIKSHPRSKNEFWTNADRENRNITLLPRETSLAAALGMSFLVVNIMSNAVVEAALSRRPIIYCNLTDKPDIFDQEKFFGNRVSNVEEFSIAISKITKDYLKFTQISEEFSKYHLANGYDGLECTLTRLSELLTDQPLGMYTQSIEGLKG